MKKFDYINLFISLITVIVFVVILIDFAVYEKEERVEETETSTYGSDYFVDISELGTWEVPDDFEPIDCELDVEIQEFAYYMAKANGIDFKFLMAVMYIESGYDVRCVSETDDYGLMQINKCNQEELSNILGITDFLDPYQSIVAGTYIFKNLFEKYGDTSKVLMAYNFGEYGAQKLWNQGIYKSKYSERVIMRMQEMGE